MNSLAHDSHDDDPVVTGDAIDEPICTCGHMLDEHVKGECAIQDCDCWYFDEDDAR